MDKNTRRRGLSRGYWFFAWLLVLNLSACGVALDQPLNSGHYKISGTGQTGELVLERVELRHSNGRASITLDPGQSPHPSAIIRYRGRGVLRANWKVDGAVMETVNLTLSHGALLQLSPRPQTRFTDHHSGRHEITLDIIAPRTSFAIPRLTYFIRPAATSQ